MGWLVWFVALAPQKLQPIVDQSQVQKESISGQTVASVADNFDRSLRVIAIESGQDFMMRKAVSLQGLVARRGPSPYEAVKVLERTLDPRRTNSSQRCNASLLWIGTES